MTQASTIRILIAIFFGLLPAAGRAAPGPEDSLLGVADEVLEQTLLHLPTTDEDSQPTRYNLWMYQNFMLMEGMDALGQVTGDEDYLRYTARSIDLFAAYQARFGDTMTAGPAGTKQWYSKPKEMWQCGMIAAYAEHHRVRPNPEFEKGMVTFDALLDLSLIHI